MTKHDRLNIFPRNRISNILLTFGFRVLSFLSRSPGRSWRLGYFLLCFYGMPNLGLAAITIFSQKKRKIRTIWFGIERDSCLSISRPFYGRRDSILGSISLIVVSSFLDKRALLLGYQKEAIRLGLGFLPVSIPMNVDSSHNFKRPFQQLSHVLMVEEDLLEPHQLTQVISKSS